MTIWMEHIARGFEVIGTGMLVLGLVFATVMAIRTLVRTRDSHGALKAFREIFGGVILLSLEILVAADLVQTVSVPLTLESVSTLGLIVLIRTFLSFSLSIEIEGVAPWRRALVSGAAMTTEAVRRAERAPA